MVEPILVLVVETLLNVFVFGVGIGKLALNAPAKNLKASDTFVSDVQLEKYEPVIEFPQGYDELGVPTFILDEEILPDALIYPFTVRLSNSPLLEVILLDITELPDKLPLKLPINTEELIDDAVTLVKLAVLGVVVPIATPSNEDTPTTDPVESVLIIKLLPFTYAS